MFGTTKKVGESHDTWPGSGCSNCRASTRLPKTVGPRALPGPLRLKVQEAGEGSKIIENCWKMLEKMLEDKRNYGTYVRVKLFML